jgi:hypothetical protein
MGGIAGAQGAQVWHPPEAGVPMSRAETYIEREACLAAVEGSISANFVDPIRVWSQFEGPPRRAYKS